MNAPSPLLLLALLPLLTGCAAKLYDPAKATRPYPDELHLITIAPEDEEGVEIQRPQNVDIQVFRHTRRLEIVNATAHSYHDFDLWINQRYTRHVGALPAGKTIRIPLTGFFDERGEAVIPGGIFRTREPTPIRLVQIQIDDEQPLVGLITIVEVDD